MALRELLDLWDAATALRRAGAGRNLHVTQALLGPSWRGLVQRRARHEDRTPLPAAGDATFDWGYQRDDPALARLYDAAKQSQWDAATALDWSRPVDPEDPARPLLAESFLPVAGLPAFRDLDRKEKARQVHATLAWLLSQFLHGEQGALFAAAQVTAAVPWLDAKLYGSTQVVDEGRHVEIFRRYLVEKLGRTYRIDDNLYVVVDAILGDARWDLKFLGMQIMIEGLALGAFGTIRRLTAEPVLRDVLRLVITDEARHVHFGVLALERLYRGELSDRERRDREDWAFEVALLLRDRFLARELRDEYYAHALSRRAWDDMVRGSGMMALYRDTMFRRIVPNLRRIGLLSDRVRPRWAAEGLLAHEHGKAAPELTAADLFDDGDAPPAAP